MDRRRGAKGSGVSCNTTSSGRCGRLESLTWSGTSQADSSPDEERGQGPIDGPGVPHSGIRQMGPVRRVFPRGQVARVPIVPPVDRCGSGAFAPPSGWRPRVSMLQWSFCTPNSRPPRQEIGLRWAKTENRLGRVLGGLMPRDLLCFPCGSIRG